MNENQRLVFEQYNGLKNNIEKLMNDIADGINTNNINDEIMAKLALLDEYMQKFNYYNNGLSNDGNVDKTMKAILANDVNNYYSRIYNIKKHLVDNYNRRVFYLNSRFDMIRSQVNSLIDSDSRKSKANLKLLNIKMPRYYNGIMNSVNTKINLDYGSLNRADEELLAVEKMFKLDRVYDMTDELNYKSNYVIPNIKKSTKG